MNVVQTKSSVAKLFNNVLLFVAIAYIFRIPHYIFGVIDMNLGLSPPRFQLFYFLVIPSVYFFLRAYYNKRLKFPHIIPFIILFSVFIFIESPIFRSGNSANYDFAIRQFFIYIYFLILVNFGLDRNSFYKIINYSFICGLIICITTYLGYVGVIKTFVQEYNVFIYGTSMRPDSTYNVNLLSYICSFSVFLLIVKQLNEKKFSAFYILRDILVILLFLSMIIINCSRGAFVMTSFLILCYIYILLSNYATNTKKRVIICALVSIALFFVLYKVDLSNLSSLFIYQRFTGNVGNFTNLQYYEERSLQLFVTWDNFLKNPIFGVGYYNAAKASYSYTTRSNFVWSQILATGGIVLFSIFIFYFFKLFAVKPKVLMKPEVAISLIFNVLYLIFNRPLFFVAVSGFIAFYFYYNYYNRSKSRNRMYCVDMS